MSLIADTQASYKKNPLLWILGSGVIARLLAVFFSGGYIASDDHFLVVHYAWRSLHGDNAWMINLDRAGHSLLYPGAHYLLFYAMNTIGIVNTEIQMTITRFLHALWSIPIVWLGYRFVERITGERRFAELTGWLLALLWIVPAFSVYQLAEMVSAVPLFIAILKAESNREKNSTREWLIAGIWLGFAVSLRYQIGFAAVGIFFALLILKKWKGALLITFGALLGTIPLGLVDWYFIGTPYANPIQYFTYNSSGEMYKYINRPWYNYILLILGVFIPPFSFLLLGGFLKAYKKLPVLFGGAFAFLLIHSIIPNKQERFIATILPVLVVVGVTGIAMWLKAERFRLSERFLRISLVIFWCLNIPVVLGTVINYNRRAEIKSLAALQSDSNLRGIILDSRIRNFNGPWYYLGAAWSQEKYLVEVKDDAMFQQVSAEVTTRHKAVDYLIVYHGKNRSSRVQQWEAVLGKATPVDSIPPAIGDRVRNFLNPKYNQANDAVVYRVRSISSNP